MEPRGLTVVHECYDPGGQYIKTDTFTIRWRSIEAALKIRAALKQEQE
jgi:hypothetical protein